MKNVFRIKLSAREQFGHADAGSKGASLQGTGNKGVSLQGAGSVPCRWEGAGSALGPDSPGQQRQSAWFLMHFIWPVAVKPKKICRLNIGLT